MSELTDKSEINRDAAKRLYDIQYYCSTVHCAYYSCIQLMMHIILYELGWTESTLTTAISNDKRTGSHEFYINLITKHLIDKKTNRDDRKLFSEEIVNLKKLRTKSDYNNEKIGEPQGRYSISKAIDIYKILQKVI
jgi:hypothetical protein